MAKRVVHWISLKKAIQSAGPKGIAMYELAARYNVSVQHDDFQHAMNILKGNTRVKFSMGVRKNDGMRCQYVQIRDDSLRRSTRNQKDVSDDS